MRRGWEQGRKLLMALAALSVIALPSPATAHDSSSLTDTAIERILDASSQVLLQVQKVPAGLLRGQQAEAWPSPKLSALDEELERLQEEIDLVLEHLYVDGGVAFESPAARIATPRAGRAFSADRGVRVARSFIEHLARLESQDTFVKEVYSLGKAAYMYDLIGGYREQMDLYRRFAELDDNPAESGRSP